MTTPPPAASPDRHAPPAPTRDELAERDAFTARTTGSLTAVRASAQTWRNGLAAFITLVTTGIVIKGRDTTTGLDTTWRGAITALIAGGLALTVIGLWQALTAEAGTDPEKRTLTDIRATYHTLAAYDIAVASRAARQLRRAKRVVGLAITLLLTGIILTWWAPSAPTTPPAYLKVTHGATTACGQLQSAGSAAILLAIADSHTPAAIPLDQVTNLAIVPTCL